MTTSLMTLRVERAEPAARGIQRFELRHPDGVELPPFTAGAHVRIKTPSGAMRITLIARCNNPGPGAPANDCCSTATAIGNGRFAFTTNTGSGTISSFNITHQGRVTLVDSDAGTTGNGSKPIDMAVGPEGRFLYVLNSGSKSIASFAVGLAGRLVSKRALTGLPDGVRQDKATPTRGATMRGRGAPGTPRCRRMKRMKSSAFAKAPAGRTYRARIGR